MWMSPGWKLWRDISSAIMLRSSMIGDVRRERAAVVDGDPENFSRLAVERASIAGRAAVDNRQKAALPSEVT